MEDVLELYERAHDPQQPVVCLDEKPAYKSSLSEISNGFDGRIPGPIRFRAEHAAPPTMVEITSTFFGDSSHRKKAKSGRNPRRALADDYQASLASIQPPWANGRLFTKLTPADCSRFPRVASDTLHA